MICSPWLVVILPSLDVNWLNMDGEMSLQKPSTILCDGAVKFALMHAFCMYGIFSAMPKFNFVRAFINSEPIALLGPDLLQAKAFWYVLSSANRVPVTPPALFCTKDVKVGM